MGVRALPTSLTLLAISMVAMAQQPAARLTLPGNAADTGAAPTLPVPGTPPQPFATGFANESFASHGFVGTPATECNNGGCDGDCRPCRQGWCNAAFFVGKSENLPDVDRRFIYGWQLGAGYWLGEERTVGIDVNVFNAHGSWRRVPGPYLIDSPVTLTTGDANLRMELLAIDCFRLDGLLGYRYLQLHERYFVGTISTAFDLATRNHVNAAQVGLAADYRYGPYFAELVGKLAVGRTSEDIDVNAVRTIEHDVSLISELTFRVGYQFGESFWGTIGYSAICPSNVERPGRHDTYYLLHGLTIGFVKRF